MKRLLNVAFILDSCNENIHSPWDCVGDADPRDKIVRPVKVSGQTDNLGILVNIMGLQAQVEENVTKGRFITLNHFHPEKSSEL